MRKNPPSAGFDKIGEGASAGVYRKGEIVEVIVNFSVFKADPKNPKKYIFSADVSREPVIYARKLLPERLKKYLPIFKKDRIDEDGLVYLTTYLPDFNGDKPDISKDDFDYIINMVQIIGLLLIDKAKCKQTNIDYFFVDINQFGTKNWAEGSVIRDPLQMTIEKEFAEYMFRSDFNVSISNGVVSLDGISDIHKAKREVEKAMAEWIDDNGLQGDEDIEYSLEYFRPLKNSLPSISNKITSLSLARYLSACMK